MGLHIFFMCFPMALALEHACCQYEKETERYTPLEKNTAIHQTYKNNEFRVVKFTLTEITMRVPFT